MRRRGSGLQLPAGTAPQRCCAKARGGARGEVPALRQGVLCGPNQGLFTAVEFVQKEHCAPEITLSTLTGRKLSEMYPLSKPHVLSYRKKNKICNSSLPYCYP